MANSKQPVEASFIVPATDADLIERQGRQLAERFTEFELIPVYGATSFFDAWRKGLAEARFPWLVLTHQDVEFRGLPEFEPCFADPATGMIGPAGSTVLTRDEPWWGTRERFVERQLSGAIDYRLATGDSHSDFGPYGEVVVLDGVCLVTTRERLDAIGGVPEFEGAAWDFYDHVLSLEFIRRDFRLFTAPFELIHSSDGAKRASFAESAESFSAVYFADRERYEVAPNTARRNGAARPPGTTEELLAEAFTLHQEKKLWRAEELCLALLRDEPANPLIHYRLGMIAITEDRFDDAAARLTQATQLDPGFAAAYVNLGAVLMRQGKRAEAIDALTTAVALNPAIPDAHNNLGEALRAEGNTAAAVESISRAVELQPDNANFARNLGRTLVQDGRAAESLEVLRRALAVRPGDGATHFELGNALRSLGRPADAVDEYRAAIEASGPSFGTLNNLALALADSGRIDDALEAFRSALEVAPDNAEILRNFATLLRKQGYIDEAIARFRRSLELEPTHAGLHSDLLYTLHYHPAYDAAALFAEHRQWNAMHAAGVPWVERPAQQPPADRLRVGYLSPDLGHHVVGQHLLPILRHHDRNRFEITCYSSLAEPDATTEELKAASERWRDIVDLSDDEAAELIAQDGIDVLVDLSLHTARNRLLVFARKPAAVQATYLGYCSTSGMDTMDYRLSDPHFDPEGSDLEVYAEETIRLPRTYWCYEPGGLTPAVVSVPAERVGYVTFGCLNNFSKVSAVALETWGALLARVPDSRLLLHASRGPVRARLRAGFAEAGVAPERIEFVDTQEWGGYIETYNRIDIALDPFPYGGGITTCDSLWMGVPVVTLSGQTAVGRGGRSILANLGLEELVADDRDAYVEIAVALAGDIVRLAALRSTLREEMEVSPLRDPAALTRDIEAAYVEMARASAAA